MKQCKNPECKKEIPEGLNYCGEDCLRRHIEIKKSREKIKSANSESAKILKNHGDSNVEKILESIGVTHDNVRQDAYNHWLRFIDFCKNKSGRNWRHDIRPKLRSWIGVDFRYIDDYLESCLSWGIMELDDGILVFKGLPE